MRNCFALLLGYCAACCVVGCVPVTSVPRVLVHDEHAAAKTAEEFADFAFVKSDGAGAYSLISPQNQRQITADKLADELSKMHLQGRPAEIGAIEFEPMPGQAAMNIFLQGRGDGESYFYRVLMVGDKGSGYKVGGFWRGSGPYPPSNRRPLK